MNKINNWFTITNLCEKQGVEVTTELRNHFNTFPEKHLLYLTTDTVGRGICVGYYQNDILKSVKLFY